jgi:hypothetical protein
VYDVPCGIDFFSGAKMCRLTKTSAFFCLVSLSLYSCQLGRPPAELPASWPIPELKLPEDAKQEYVAEYSALGNRGTPTYSEDGRTIGVYSYPWEAAGLNFSGGINTRWSVGFDTSRSWPTLKQQISSSLLPLGYTVFHEKDDGTVPSMSWLSPAGDMYVSLAKVHLKALAPGTKSFYGHELIVFKLANPLAPGTTAETR